ncbi:MAG TPA: TldD/PmbA family protein [Anaerolineales bacterium]
MTEMNLPAEMAALRPGLKGIVAEGLERAPWFSVLLSSRQGLTISVDNREENVSELAPSRGTVLSAFDGATIYERALAGFDADEVRGAGREFVRGINFQKYKSPEQPEQTADFATPVKIDPMRLSVQEKLDRCRELHKRLQGRDPRLVNARVNYMEFNEHSIFAGRSTDLAQRVQRIRLSVFVVVAGQDGQIQYDILGKSGGAGWEVLDYTDEELDKVVKGAVDLLSAERIEPGEYWCISSPGVSGTICHESFGHGVETDMFLKQRARAAQFIDKRVGSDLVYIGDDPSMPGPFGSYFFDDEGQLASPTTIVEDGLFRRGITDKYSATALGIPRSANGRRQDFSRKAYARMSNTFFGAGKTSLEDMLAQVDYGIYLDKWSSGMEDPLGWGIQVTCHYGHEIRNGRITDKVFAPVGISGYVPEVLGSITAVGDRLLMDGGHCGKGHKEIVPVASGGPHLLMKARLG